MRIILRTLLLLLPLALFSGGLCWAVAGKPGLSTVHTLLVVIAAAVVAVCWEVYMLRQWVLPALGDFLARCLYAGHYCSADDELAQLVQRITEEQDRSLLPDLEALVRRHPGRLRGWQELAHLQRTLAADPRAACETLLKGSRAVRNKQDRALLLYRAAMLRAHQLNDRQGACELLRTAADRYPRTTYGRKAGDELTRLR